jgi:hypothetical protein
VTPPPLAEIEYRTRWLVKNFSDDLAPEVLREELGGIAEAARRMNGCSDSLSASIRRAEAWFERPTSRRGPIDESFAVRAPRHLRLVRPVD